MTGSDANRAARRQPLRWATAALVIAALGSSCGSGTLIGTGPLPASAPAATTAPSSSDGTRTFSDPADHFSLAVPSGWQQVSLDSPTSIAAFKDLLARNPRSAAAMGSADSLAAKGLKYLAVDPVGGSTVNVQVNVSPGLPARPSDSYLEAAFADMKDGLGQLGETIKAHRLVSINGRRVLQADTDVPLQTASASLTLHATIDVFVTADTVHILTLVGDPAIVSAVENSFTVLQ